MKKRLEKKQIKALVESMTECQIDMPFDWRDYPRTLDAILRTRDVRPAK